MRLQLDWERRVDFSGAGRWTVKGGRQRCKAPSRFGGDATVEYDGYYLVMTLRPL